MLSALLSLLLFSLFFTALAQDSPPANACGNVIREASSIYGGDGTAYAVDVFDCFTTVPFNAAVGSRQVTYINDTLQFQSTLEYLKHPPAGYQQPAVDLIAGLGEIQNAIDTGAFANEYQFEAAIQNVLYSANDAHVSFVGGVLSSFSFGSQYGLTSLSLDGIQLPKVYLTVDLLLNQSNPSTSWQPSAVSQINGTDVLDYLTRFAALNSYGSLEPNADWNMLFDNPVIDVLGESYPLWGGGATFYPGDIFNYTFENGSVFTDEFLAAYYDPGAIGPLETGGDFYNFFVLGFLPAACSDPVPPPSCTSVNTTNSSSETAPTSYADITDAYPTPNVAQDNLTIDGYTTGYYLPEASLAVLSLPTFWADGDAIQDFVTTVQNFLNGAKEAGLKKVVIDLQQNDGGDALLAYTIFKVFFPSIDPFAGSERRSFPLADTLGSLITPFWQTLQLTNPDVYVGASADEWIATVLLNATTDTNFTSWDELFGPYFDGVDNLSAIQRLNTSDYDFDFSSFGAEQPPDVLLAPFVGDPPYAAEDVVMLSDGLCSSACSLFMEMMNHDAGVKNVVVGGRPAYGPMQTPSGSRGASFYGLDELDADIGNAADIYEAMNDAAPPNVPNRTEVPIFYYNGGISLRAQVREGTTIPLAMQYLAADCRIFYTPATFNNFTNLWKYAADAIWTTPSLCVQGSTGFATTGDANPQPPPASTPLAAANYSNTGIPDLHLSGSDIPFLFTSLPALDLPPEVLPRVSVTVTKLQPTRPLALTKEQLAALEAQEEAKTTKQRRLHKNTAPSSKRRRRAALRK